MIPPYLAPARPRPCRPHPWFRGSAVMRAVGAGPVARARSPTGPTLGLGWRREHDAGRGSGFGTLERHTRPLNACKRFSGCQNRIPALLGCLDRRRCGLDLTTLSVTTRCHSAAQPLHPLAVQSQPLRPDNARNKTPEASSSRALRLDDAHPSRGFKGATICGCGGSGRVLADQGSALLGWWVLAERGSALLGWWVLAERGSASSGWWVLGSARHGWGSQPTQGA